MFAGNTTKSLTPVDVNAVAGWSAGLPGYGGIGGSLAIPSPNVYIPTVTGIPDITITTTPVPALPGDTVFVSREDTPFYPEIAERRELYVPASEPTDELTDLKEQINSSFEEVASLLGGLQDQLADLEGRIARYNGKSSHKI